MSDTGELLVMAAVWALIAAVIARFIPGWPARIVVFGLLVGIPFWELPYGYYNFRELCREEARLQVLEKIPPQQVVCADYPFIDLHQQLLRSGFSTVETRGKRGEIKKYSLSSSNQIAESPQTRLASEYCLTFTSNTRLSWRVLRHDVLITRVADGRVVARQSQFDWFGMWWQQQASPVLGRGGGCFDDPSRPRLALRDGAG